MQTYHYRVTIKHPHADVYHTLRVQVDSDRELEYRDWIANTAVPSFWGAHMPWHKFVRRVAPSKVRVLDEKPWHKDLKLRGMSEVTADGTHIRECFCLPHELGPDSPGLFAFIHPTKTGGTAVEKYLNINFPRHISGNSHLNRADDAIRLGKIPIVIIRDPVDRFKSSYYYWKNGAATGPYVRDKKWRPAVDSIKGYIDLLKTDDVAEREVLNTWFTNEEHYAQQSDWTPKASWPVTIVVLYSKMHLMTHVRLLLQKIGLIGAGDPLPDLPIVNPSKRDKEPVALDDEDMDFLRDYYKDDFEMWYHANNNPSMFRVVIGPHE